MATSNSVILLILVCFYYYIIPTILPISNWCQHNINVGGLTVQGLYVYNLDLTFIRLLFIYYIINLVLSLLWLLAFAY